MAEWRCNLALEHISTPPPIVERCGSCPPLLASVAEKIVGVGERLAADSWEEHTARAALPTPATHPMWTSGRRAEERKPVCAGTADDAESDTCGAKMCQALTVLQPLAVAALHSCTFRIKRIKRIVGGGGKRGEFGTNRPIGTSGDGFVGR